jgi:hypothetical protein
MPPADSKRVRVLRDADRRAWSTRRGQPRSYPRHGTCTSQPEGRLHKAANEDDLLVDRD